MQMALTYNDSGLSDGSNIFFAKGTFIGMGCLPAEASAQAGAPLLQDCASVNPYLQVSVKLKYKQLAKTN
jgi:hypothetical protein